MTDESGDLRLLNRLPDARGLIAWAQSGELLVLDGRDSKDGQLETARELLCALHTLARLRRHLLEASQEVLLEANAARSVRSNQL